MNQNQYRNVVLNYSVSEKYANKKGITLISLVVTIIILLILAGVTLALISGSDGILGRASHALDENKIAMAKEQVELALSDFQTEFFEGKYVERTNDGTKKEYISEKLQAGVKTTNFYAQAFTDEKVAVYEGEDTSGTEVVKGTIQEDASIQWDITTEGSSGGDNSGGNGDLTEEGNNSSGGNVNSEEITQLKATIAGLQDKINTLENEQKTTNRTLDSILTSQTRKDILYEGSASEQKTYNFAFPTGKTLNDYKMLVFYIDAYYKPTNAWITKQTAMAEVKIRDELYDYGVTYDQERNPNNWWNLYFSIPNANQFRIDVTDLGEEFAEARIYKVIGIY